jgi:hypothetical protein
MVYLTDTEQDAYSIQQREFSVSRRPMEEMKNDYGNNILV